MLNTTSEFHSLDDLLNATYNKILAEGQEIKSKRGNNIELTNFSATLIKPRTRTSMSLDRQLVKSKFAEFAWYLSKDTAKEYITPYIRAYHKEEQENSKILGGYGPKIFAAKKDQLSQFERIVKQISARPSTKQAFLSISDEKDYKLREEKYSSPPCTIGLHFYVRKDKLYLTAFMRSNDAYFGLPHDIFCFTMLQELVACRTKFSLGSYTHIATSMHVYENHIKPMKQYLKEGFHEPIEMPAIQSCNEEALNYVSKEFDKESGVSNYNLLDDYWKDYVLFSNKHNQPAMDKERFLSKFTNDRMRLIAQNSLGK